MATLYLVTLAAFCLAVLCALICADVSLGPQHSWSRAAALPPDTIARLD